MLQGAVFLDWTRDAIDTSSELPVQLQQDADLLAAALEAKGVSSDKPVVVSRSSDPVTACRSLSKRCHLPHAPTTADTAALTVET